MSNGGDFFQQYRTFANPLETWVSNKFYPYIKKMNHKEGSFHVYDISDNNGNLSILNNKGDDISDFDILKNELTKFQNKSGIYGFFINVNKKSAFIYIGKAKKLNIRVRQHLTGKNFNSHIISKNTGHKYADICTLSKNGRVTIKFFIWTNKKLTNSPNIDYELASLEALLISKTKEDFKKFNMSENLNLKHLNIRIG